MTYTRKGIVTAMAFVATFAAGYGVHLQWPAAHAVTAVAPSTAPITRGAVAPDAFAAIVESQGAAVVNISVTGMTRTAAGGLQGIDPDSPFYDFFRRFGVPQQGGPQERTPISGQGSGFIVDANGIVLTNAHVVANADEVTVKLTDKREFKAKVLGVDKPTDVAVLRIDALVSSAQSGSRAFLL